MSILKFIRGIVASALALFVVFHAQAQTLDQIQKRGKVLVGVDLTTAPFGFTDAQLKPTGVDVEVAGLIAAGLGVPLEIVPVTGPNRIPYLLTNKVDLVVSTFSITPERARTISFSNPYAATQIVLLSEKAKKLEKPADLAGKSVAVVRGTVQDTQLTLVAPKETVIRRFDDDATAATALLSGQVEAIATGSVIGNELVKRGAQKQLELKFVLTQSTYSIGIRKGDPELLHWLNTTLYYYRLNGALAKVHEKFIGGQYPAMGSF
jgi:polar amino acid transport system substrate-binding protein